MLVEQNCGPTNSTFNVKVRQKPDKGQVALTSLGRNSHHHQEAIVLFFLLFSKNR